MMEPKILFRDDRMFVLEVAPVTSRELTSNKPPKEEWEEYGGKTGAASEP